MTGMAKSKHDRSAALYAPRAFALWLPVWVDGHTPRTQHSFRQNDERFFHGWLVTGDRARAIGFVVRDVEYVRGIERQVDGITDSREPMPPITRFGVVAPGAYSVTVLLPRLATAISPAELIAMPSGKCSCVRFRFWRPVVPLNLKTEPIEPDPPHLVDDIHVPGSVERDIGRIAKAADLHGRGRRTRREARSTGRRGR